MFIPIVTSGDERCDSACRIPRAATGRFTAASVVIAARVLTVAFIQTGNGVVPPDGAAAVAVIAAMLSGMLVNGVARRPGLPVACAVMTSIAVVAGATLGIDLTTPYLLGGLLFVPLLAATSSRTWTPAVAATVLMVVASFVAAGPLSGPAA